MGPHFDLFSGSWLSVGPHFHLFEGPGGPFPPRLGLEVGVRGQKVKKGVKPRVGSEPFSGLFETPFSALFKSVSGSI